ncbi:uncharacterized protein MYCFIDRAFT_200987 [Pseudocercospora fijiensis CIRAD86]|uniref:Uncharacterized protein n=1 Tax=Pseudocercospora fijiensis (strain CIRAD86) TaxID=383855 RepID=M3AH35_PSEFD|nr:uncharacterized protein MYCFIDRAFT_200987 [Pseudocercospora fijiensis CIRAD86]EME76802.1 hypothetical protein MYCFIDRAFT_200987 [Pseudocercospora fijiensis CIRAD86]
MPKHRSNSDPDDPYLPSDDEDSDPEDFIIHWGGLTSSEAKSWRGKKINLDLHTKTIIFKHAVSKGYSSKRPPTVHDLLDLIYTVQLPRQGLRATKRFVKCLASWISSNISQHNLVGLLFEECVGIKPPVYRVCISSALLDAVQDPAFSYNFILALQRSSDCPIMQAHARNNRSMQLFGGQPEPRPGMEQTVRDVMSHMVASGQIASPTPATKAYHTPYPSHPGMPPMFHAAPYPPYTSAQAISGMPNPLNPAFHQYGPPNTGMSNQQHSQPPGPIYGPPEYLYEKDRVNASQNHIAYEKWLEYVKVKLEQHRSMRTPGSAVLPDDLQDAINFNNGVRDFFPQHDYIGWLIDHPEAMAAAS